MRRFALVAALFLTMTLVPLPAAGSIEDACPPGQTPSSGFVDPAGNTHEAAIDCVVWYGIAHGISEAEYGPSLPVRRDQMASFMARTLDALDVALPAPSDQGFTDIDGNPHRDRINQLAAVGIVAGTAAGIYAPAQHVRRDQMATFLVRTYEYAAEELSASHDYFTDTQNNPHEENINKAAEAGFTAGTKPGIYSPALAVRRDQMASFIARMLSAADPERPDQPPSEPADPPPDDAPPSEPSPDHPEVAAEFSGSGQTLTEAFELAEWLLVAEATHEGESNFIIWLLDEDGERTDLLANEIGDYDGSRATGVREEGTHWLDINADGDWTVRLLQPIYDQGEPVPTTFSGEGPTATGPFQTEDGLNRFEYSHTGESNFIVWVLDNSGERHGLVANEIGDASGSTGQGLPAGVYVLDVRADGVWSVTVE